MSTMRINGLKSHDYHIWIERLLPVMVRGYLPDQVWQVLVELSFFFRQLCTKELSSTVVEEMERMVPVLYGPYIVWTSISTIYNFAFGLLYCKDCCMELYRLLYGFVLTIVWI